MKIISIKVAKYIFIVFLSLVIFGWASVEFGKDETFFHGYPIEKPIIKIGLGVNLSLIQIQSSSGMKIYEVNPNYRLVAEDVADVQIKGSREKLTEKFLNFRLKYQPNIHAKFTAPKDYFKYFFAYIIFY